MDRWRGCLRAPALPGTARFPSLPRLSCICDHLQRVIPGRLFSRRRATIDRRLDGLSIEIGFRQFNLKITINSLCVHLLFMYCRAAELERPGPALTGPSAGISNPEISDLTHNQPRPHCHDREDFVPGRDFLSLWCAILFVIMKADRLNTPAVMCTKVPAFRAPHASPCRT